MNSDGSMAKDEQLVAVARVHGLLCTTVEAISGWRRRADRQAPGAGR